MIILPPKDCKVCNRKGFNACALVSDHNCPGMILEALFAQCHSCLNRVPIKYNHYGERPYHVWAEDHQVLCGLNLFGREVIRTVLGQDYIPDYPQEILKAKNYQNDYSFL